MLKILICCGGGFSSSALAAHMEKEVQEKHLSDVASFEFVPFLHLKDRKEPYDIAMLCPLHSTKTVWSDECGMLH